MTTGAVILAAGKASRFGSPKQLLEIEGETLIDRACQTALEAGCDPVLRVLGGHAEVIQSLPCPAGVSTLVHDGWQQGMGSSLAAGVARLLELAPDLDALFVLLVDQPMITPALLETLRGGLATRSIVWCDHGEAKGPPALFGRRHFEELMHLQGDRGAKAVIANHQATSISFPGAAWDIDSPEAWERFQTRAKE
ncbi:MAG: nucleotidyltransferase family protein [Verrucomicrobiaceae bacterium]|nr:MAG: nucleotidyltransferase family protein [Verrucomicrobiaceae bacterium]